MTEETKPTEAQNPENSGAENTASSSAGVELSTIYGQKAGMTQIYDEAGNHVPVTVIKLIPNVVSQVKTAEKEGYTSYQLAFGEKREKLVKKPLKGHLKKAGVDKNLTKFAELRTDEVSAENLGKDVALSAFASNTYVDVTATSKGKGFQGVIKRHGFSGGPGAHGSKFHRGPGSIGMSATPGHVFKNKKMPGQMGNKKVTVQNLKVVEVNEDKGYMLIKGAVPGSKNGFVRISRALKK